MTTRMTTRSRWMRLPAAGRANHASRYIRTRMTMTRTSGSRDIDAPPRAVGTIRLLFFDPLPDLVERLAGGEGSGLVPLVAINFALVGLALALDGVEVRAHSVLRRALHDPVLERV